MNPYGIRLTREEKVACVTFDRPERQNALDETMWNDMARVLEDLRGNLPRAVGVTGAGGKSFCAGFDVQLDNPHARRFFEAIEGRDPGAIRLIIERIRTLTDALTLLPVPFIAAINGLAYGGGAEIASVATCGRHGSGSGHLFLRGPFGASSRSWRCRGSHPSGRASGAVGFNPHGSPGISPGSPVHGADQQDQRPGKALEEACPWHG